MARRPRSPLSGGQLLLTIAGIVFVTAVVPPGAAWSLNRYRVNQTQERATQAALRLRAAATIVPPSRAAGVACGPGEMPTIRSTGSEDDWVRNAVAMPEVFGAGMPTDAWGRCFLMNIGEWPRGGRVWIVSAGANGFIDTPLGATALSGDDIGAIVR